MPNEPRLEEQLGRYGAWLEEHLHTGLRAAVPVTDDQEQEERAARRRWAVVVTSCLAVVALLAVAIAMLRDEEPTTQPVSAAETTIEWATHSGPSPFGRGTPVGLAGGAAGFLALTAIDRTRAVWYSADGEQWAEATPPGDLGELQAVAATTDALWLLARPTLPGDGTITLSRLYRTTDGTDWTVLTPDELILPPLLAAGDVLFADVITEGYEAPAPRGWSTNGQDWSVAEGFPPIATPMDLADVGGTLYASVDNGEVLRSDDAGRWTAIEPPAFVPTQLLGTGEGLIALRDALNQACIGVGIGTVLTEPPAERAGCLGSPQVALLGDAGAWQTIESSDKPMGSFPSPTVHVAGQLVSATVDYQAQLRVSTSADLGATWVTPDVRLPVVIQQGNFEPLVAATDRHVVALASSVGDPAAVLLVGHVRGEMGPPPSPRPTEAPGSTLPADATLPGATDPGQTWPPPEVSGPVPSTNVTPRISVTFRLDSTTVVAGGFIDGAIDVVNFRSSTVLIGDDIEGGGGAECKDSFIPTISNGTITVTPDRTADCQRLPWEFPPGVTTIPIRVMAAFTSCTNSGNTEPGMLACPENGMPPIPAGRYTVTISNPLGAMPIQPPSIEIEVLEP